MAVAPFAKRRLIRPGSNDPRIRATQVILHVAVSEGRSLFDFFARRSGGIESHFYIRRDGTVEQYRDTAFEADANYTANNRAISIETQGMGHGEWTRAQMDSIKRLLMWAHDVHGIPLRVCPRHDAPGIGYHVLFGAPGPWTPVAKSCPGPDRIRQFNNDLVPWMNRGATAPEEDTLSWTEKIKNFEGQGGEEYTARNWLLRIFNSARRIDQQMDTVEKRLATLDQRTKDLPTRAEVERMLESLDATIKLVVKENQK